jgi:hypothetical protein
VKNVCFNRSPAQTSRILDSETTGRIAALLRDPVMETPISENLPQLSDYEIYEHLGTGATGSVYMAIPKSQPETVVAVKIFKIEQGAKSLPSRILRELDLLTALRLPCVPSISDYGVDQGRFYIATEVVRGMNVDRYCESHNLSREQRVALLAEVASSVQQLHEFAPPLGMVNVRFSELLRIDPKDRRFRLMVERWRDGARVWACPDGTVESHCAVFENGRWRAEWYQRVPRALRGGEWKLMVLLLGPLLIPLAIALAPVWLLVIRPLIRREAQQREQSMAKARAELAERNIGTSIHFLPVHTLSAYRERFPEQAPLPAVELRVPLKVDARAADNWDDAH